MSAEQTKAFWDMALRSFLPDHGISAIGVQQIIMEQSLMSADDRKALRILLSRAAGLPPHSLPPYEYSKVRATGRGLR